MTYAPRRTGDCPATPGAPGRGVAVVAWLVAAWCLAFAIVNLVQEVSGRFADGPFTAYAAGLSVMAWIVLALKLLGAAVALLSVARLPDRVPPRLVAVLAWGAAALLGLYSAGSVVEAAGMATGLTGSADQITPAGVGYVVFFLLGACGYAVLATSFSRRYGIGRRTALIGVLGAPLLLGAILVAVPMLLVALGVMPG